MFKKSNPDMAKHNDMENGSHNQIAKGTVINGDIETQGVLRIDGTLVGSINSKGKVVVGPTGKIEGDVLCQSANIQGEMKGKIVVEELLALQATAKVTGDITMGKLSVEPGAILSGHTNMGGVVKELNAESDKSKQRASGSREFAQAE